MTGTNVSIVLATGQSMHHDPQEHVIEKWIYVSISTLVSLLLIYLISAQLIFGGIELWKRHKRKFGTERHTISNYAILIDILIIIVTIFTAIPFIQTVIVRELKHPAEECTASEWLSTSAEVLADHAGYYVMWLRQRLFYTNAALRHLSNRVIRIISFVSLLTLSSLFVFALVVSTGETGCLSGLQNREKVLVLGMEILNQMCIVILFVHPLMKHNRETSRANIVSVGQPMIYLIRRTVVTAVIYIVTDLAMGIYLIYGSHIHAILFMLEVNTLINLACMLGSFPNWKERIAPWNLLRQQSTILPQSSSVTVKCEDTGSKTKQSNRGISNPNRREKGNSGPSSTTHTLHHN